MYRVSANDVFPYHMQRFIATDSQMFSVVLGKDCFVLTVTSTISHLEFRVA